jgi:hypothetical protein
MLTIDSQLRKSSRVYALSSLISIVAFISVVGVNRLNPANIGWLSHGAWNDMWAHYLGWESYRRDSWRIPIGANQLLGEKLGNSIVYTDSIPILAVLFKPISYLLPNQFQYFGFWLLVCFLGQSIASTKLLLKVTENELLILLSSSLLLFVPILFHRLNTHVALSSHFLILFALYFFVDERTNFSTRRWNLLLVFSVSVHVYIFVMNFIMYLAWLASRGKVQEVSFRRKFRSLVVSTSILLFVMWALGYFVALGSNIQDSLRNLGAPFSNTLFKFDLLQPFNFFGWSYVASRYGSETLGNFDAFGYLGPGYIFLLSVSFLYLRETNNSLFHLLSKYKHLSMAIFLMFLYSLTNTITIARKEILSFELPKQLLPIIEIFRSAGRFAWPLLYSIMLFLIYLVLRKQKLAFSMLLLTLASIFQLVDTNYYWRNLSELSDDRRVREELLLPSNLSIEIGRAGNRLVSYSDVKKYWEPCPYWDLIGYIAIENSISTNCIRTSKLNVEELRISNNFAEQEIVQKRLRKDTSYFLNGFLDSNIIGMEYIKFFKEQTTSHYVAEENGLFFLIPRI